MHGRVIGLHVNRNGGVPKYPVEALLITTTGCAGDKQNDLRYHGGTERAVCLLQSHVLQELQEKGHPIHAGSTGENILISGLEEVIFCAGMQMSLGEVVITITKDAPPCKTIRAAFIDEKFQNLSHASHPGHTRWYARVDKEGTVHLQDVVNVLN